MRQDQYKVLIIGLGKIGLQYDLGLNPKKFILTHARAFSAHQDFILVGGIDSCAVSRGMFEKEYRCPSYRSIEEAQNLGVDIAVVATPTNTHYEITVELLEKFNPKAILCEKPLAYSLEEAKRITEYCSRKQSLLFVNYIRRSDISSSMIQTMIRSGEIQTPLKGVCWYTKGVYNNGSHFINLLELWFGEVTGVKSLNKAKKRGDDFDVDIIAHYGSSDIIFLSTEEKNYSNYSIELISPSGRLLYGCGGYRISWQKQINHPDIANYRTLEDTGTTIYSEFNRAQANVVDQLAQGLKGAATNLCTGEAAVQTNNVLERIRIDF